MAKLLVLYNKPSDPARFDEYYRGTHTPLAKKIPGLQQFELSRGQIATPEGESNYHQIATLSFASPDALQAALASPEGQSAAADIANFADGGAEILIFDDQVV